jgi:predicted transcriptional regulator
VQKLLGRLESKGCVSRDQSVWPRLFRPAIERAELINRRLQITANELCQGSFGPLLTHLVRDSTLTRAERSKLRALLEELDRDSGA